MWDELAAGALGAVVLADTRRLDNCFAAVDFFERRGIPFVVGGQLLRRRAALHGRGGPRGAGPRARVPVVLCDVRGRESSKEVLIALTEHVLAQADLA